MGAAASYTATLARTAPEPGAKVVIGGSSIITPLNFLEAIAGITNDAVRQKVLKPIPPLDLEPDNSKDSQPRAQAQAQAAAARTGAPEPQDSGKRWARPRTGPRGMRRRRGAATVRVLDGGPTDRNAGANRCFRTVLTPPRSHVVSFSGRPVQPRQPECRDGVPSRRPRATCTLRRCR